MYKLVAPTIDSTDSYNSSVATIRDKIKQVAYENVASTVKLCCEKFDEMAASQKFDDARSTNFEVSGLGDYTMADLYDSHFAKNNGTKIIRSSIRNLAPNSLCPYCGDGMVAELDHYLPKSSFDGTTVHPLNLVPACRDCNYEKKAYKPSSNSSAVLHPYFDTAFDYRWLSASTVQGELGLPAVVFSIDTSEGDSALHARLNAHMQVFNLWHRFSIKAAQELNDFKRMVDSDIGREMSLGKARLYLNLTARRYFGNRANSWKGAVHEAMSDSDWYLIDYLGLK